MRRRRDTVKKIDRCPCCGGYAKVRRVGNAYTVRCGDCGMMSRSIYRNGGVSPAQMQNMVIDAWNRRVRDA
jgi:transcription elongation factor Elf1